jgi:hypothetical protein
LQEQPPPSEYRGDENRAGFDWIRKKGVSHSVKNGVVILTGKVGSEARRAKAQTVASSVPNVRQVVNELEVKDRKATSSN